MCALVPPIQSRSDPLTYRLPHQSLSNKKNNKKLMAFKIVVLYPNFDESVVFHLKVLEYASGSLNRKLGHSFDTYLILLETILDLKFDNKFLIWEILLYKTGNMV